MTVVYQCHVTECFGFLFYHRGSGLRFGCRCVGARWFFLAFVQTNSYHLAYCLLFDSVGLRELVILTFCCLGFCYFTTMDSILIILIVWNSSFLFCVDLSGLQGHVTFKTLKFRFGTCYATVVFLDR